MSIRRISWHGRRGLWALTVFGVTLSLLVAATEQAAEASVGAGRAASTATSSSTPADRMILLAPSALKPGADARVRPGQAAAVVADPTTPNPGRNLTNPPPCSPQPCSNPTGPVITNLVIYNIFWLPAGQHYDNTSTSAGDADYENLINQFTGDLGGTPHFNIVTQYPGSNGTPANSVTFGGSYVDTFKLPHTGMTTDPLRDKDIRDAATRAINNNKSWAQDINHLYAVFVPYGVHECQDDGKQCTFTQQPGTLGDPTNSFCAWHNHMKSPGGTDFPFSFQDDNQFLGTGCGPDAPFPAGNAAAHKELKSYAHEVIEAVTDPDINAWISPEGGKEIGDLCGQTYSPKNAQNANIVLKGHNYILQQEWSNLVSGCAPDRCAMTVCSPTLSLAMTAPAAVHSDQTITYAFAATNPSDTNPATNITATFTPASGSPTVSTAPAIAVKDSFGSNVTVPADAANNLPANTKVTGCVSYDYADSQGTAQPAIKQCATTTVLNDPPVLSVAADQSGDYHDPLTFSVSATDNETTDVLTFSQSGLPAGLTLTDNGNRTATVSGSPTAPAGSYPVTISVFDGHNPPVTAALNVAVTREETSLGYTGDTHIANGTPAHLAASLKEDGTTPIGGRNLTLTLGAGSTAQTCPATTDATGTGRCTIPSVSQALVGNGAVPLTATFGGDQFYLPSSASAKALLLYMTGHAIGASVSAGPLPSQVFADTGAIVTPSAGTTQRNVLTALTPLATVFGVSANVTTTVAPGGSQAQASVSSVILTVLGLPVIVLRAVQATSRTDCSASSGQTSITLLQIGPNASLNLAPAPNTVIPLGLGRLILNEQILTADPTTGSTSLTVNAVHVITPLADVVLSSATSDIHNCG